MGVGLGMGVGLTGSSRHTGAFHESKSHVGTRAGALHAGAGNGAENSLASRGRQTQQGSRVMAGLGAGAGQLAPLPRPPDGSTMPGSRPGIPSDRASIRGSGRSQDSPAM